MSLLCNNVELLECEDMILKPFQMTTAWGSTKQIDKYCIQAVLYVYFVNVVINYKPEQ
jgi:hypothetical protein